MTHEIVIYPNPILETPCETVTDFNAELKELVAEMFEVMYAAHGVGLAANQIGVSKRIAVVDVDWTHDTKTQFVLINPKIIRTMGRFTASEGCLSVPEVREMKERPVTTIVEFQNLNGKTISLTGTWLLSRAINHDVDHLNGKLCLSKHLCEEVAKSRKTMTALSIPERAREIAERIHKEGSCVLSAEYSHTDLTCVYEIDEFIKVAEEAMHSERELCAKELEAKAEEARAAVKECREEGMTDGYVVHAFVTELETCLSNAKLLREGGQK